MANTTNICPQYNKNFIFKYSPSKVKETKIWGTGPCRKGIFLTRQSIYELPSYNFLNKEHYNKLKQYKITLLISSYEF